VARGGAPQARWILQHKARVSWRRGVCGVMSHRLALEGHAEKLLAVKASAERLDDAVAGGQNLRVVVSASRTLRLDLVEMLADFQACSRPRRCLLFACPDSVPLLCAARSCPLRSLPMRLANLYLVPLTCRHSGTTRTVCRRPLPRQTKNAWNNRARSSSAGWDCSMLALYEGP
jgi:hypothetical protein